MFGIDLVGSAFRVGGSVGVAVWAASPPKAGGTAGLVELDARRKWMGALGLGLVLFARRLPPSMRPVAAAAGAGALAIYSYTSIVADRAAASQAGVETPAWHASLLRSAKRDVGMAT